MLLKLLIINCGDKTKAYLISLARRKHSLSICWLLNKLWLICLLPNMEKETSFWLCQASFTARSESDPGQEKGHIDLPRPLPAGKARISQQAVLLRAGPAQAPSEEHWLSCLQVISREIGRRQWQWVFNVPETPSLFPSFPRFSLVSQEKVLQLNRQSGMRPGRVAIRDRNLSQ